MFQRCLFALAIDFRVDCSLTLISLSEETICSSAVQPGVAFVRIVCNCKCSYILVCPRPPEQVKHQHWTPPFPNPPLALAVVGLLLALRMQWVTMHSCCQDSTRHRRQQGTTLKIRACQSGQFGGRANQFPENGAFNVMLGSAVQTILYQKDVVLCLPQWSALRTTMHVSDQIYIDASWIIITCPAKLGQVEGGAGAGFGTATQSLATFARLIGLQTVAGESVSRSRITLISNPRWWRARVEGSALPRSPGQRMGKQDSELFDANSAWRGARRLAACWQMTSSAGCRHWGAGVFFSTPNFCGHTGPDPLRQRLRPKVSPFGRGKWKRPLPAHRALDESRPRGPQGSATLHGPFHRLDTIAP